RLLCATVCISLRSVTWYKAQRICGEDGPLTFSFRARDPLLTACHAVHSAFATRGCPLQEPPMPLDPVADGSDLPSGAPCFHWTLGPLPRREHDHLTFTCPRCVTSVQQ